MIYHLNGRLIEKHPTHVVIECGGVGYLVSISLTTYEALTDDESIFLNIYMVVREDAMTLYGFATQEERRMFLLLIGVSGVGANTARLILSAMNPAKTTEVIASGDSDTMKKVKGIGAKTAQRIIIDLQDKVGPETGGGDDVSEISSQHNTLKNEALLALSTLGFDKARVENTLSRILENSERDYTLEVLIKQALKEL
ncbi:MAG: Holliday junction branch migration protein RuvA [Crocinitomicaceae bacterium]|nr:Holliday junction branch migration protein RuvA [Crocinitomicaceae bacterium]MAU77013.1 Holliday junction branch migration protein RuvA [Crocinitomicaceae bacterium]|tara:strand:+ start:1794 stop:2387 length:594 start_codon:yes stop_codon:yes gene_type:complete